MPLVAADSLKPKKIILLTSEALPEDQKEWVVLDVGPVLGEDFIKLDSLESVLDFQYQMLVSRLLEWNVCDTNGEIAPINKDTVKRLPLEDLTFLLKEVNAEAEDMSLPKAQPNS